MPGIPNFVSPRISHFCSVTGQEKKHGPLLPGQPTSLLKSDWLFTYMEQNKMQMWFWMLRRNAERRQLLSISAFV